MYHLLLRIWSLFLLVLCGWAFPVLKAAEIDFPVFVGGFGLRYFDETARMFEEKHPQYKVNIYGDPRISDKVKIRVIGGDYPDATDADLPWAKLIEGGKVLDLSPWLDGPSYDGGESWRETFTPGVLDRWKREGAYYGIPFGHAVFPVFYNKALFQAHGWNEPETWEDFWHLCGLIRAEGIAPMAFSGISRSSADYLYRAALYSAAGEEGYRAQLGVQKGSFDNEPTRMAAEVLRRLSSEAYISGWQGLSHTEAQARFFRGEAAMIVTGSWLVNEMRGSIPVGFELGAMNFPRFKDGAGEADAIQVGSGWYFVFADSAEREGVLLFLRFLTSWERATAFTRETDSPTALATVGQDAFSPQMADIARLLEEANTTYGRPPGASAEVLAFHQSYIDLRNRLMDGHLTAAQFAHEAESAAAVAREVVAGQREIEWHYPLRLVLMVLLLAVAVFLLLLKAKAGRTARAGESTTEPKPSSAYCFLVPALLLYGLVVAIPAIVTFYWSLISWDGIGEREFVGGRNLLSLLVEDRGFGIALRNNLFLMIVPTLVIIPLSLFFAYSIHRGVPGKGLFRASFLFPNMLGGAAASILWVQIYSPAGGLLSGFLRSLSDGVLWLGLEGMSGVFSSWAATPWLAQDNLYWSLVPVYIWLCVGFNMVLFLAAMQGVEKSLYEAAEIEGASPRKQFFSITLPLIREVIIVAVVFMIITGLNTFEMVWLLTSQQPETRTHVIGTLMISTLFQQMDVGRAAALATILFLLVFAGSVIALYFSKEEARDA